MKKRAVLLVFLVAVGFLFASTPIASAQAYSGFEKFTDSVKLFFAKGDDKANLALEIREKEVNSAIFNLKAGNAAGAEKNLDSASEKLRIVQDIASPDISANVKESVDKIESKIQENNYELLDSYLAEEEKTKLSMDISEKTLSYCDELAMQDYASMQKDEKCKSYVWMENKIKQRLTEEQEKAKSEIENQVQACMNNPKECSCDNVQLLSEKTRCEEFKSLAIKCEFQGDDSACEKIKEFNPQETERDRYEKEILEKYLPAECSEAGVRDGEECKKLILTLNQPKTECMENGEYIGEERCQERLVNRGEVVKDCVVDGKLVDPEQCLNIVKENNKPTGKEWELMSGECKERGVYDPVACDEIVNLPRPCKDAGYYTKKECEVMTLNQNLPQECIDAGALTPEACEKLKLPSDCQGAYSREECEKVKIEQKFPEECQSAGEFDPEKCAVIMVGEESVVVTPGAEMEYLIRNGLTFEDIPGVCMNGKTFIRSMQCDEELAKLGITLPTPTDTGRIPKECMVDERTAVSPKECQNRMEQKIIVDTIPKECQDSGITAPEECSEFMEEKRIEAGIGLNMPEECMGVSIEECKEIMGQKGIAIVETNEEADLPKECQSMGVSDVIDCKMIVGRVNEERIKNGEKIVVDEEGKVDYVPPEQIEKILDDSEKAVQEIEPNFEKAEEMKQEINNLEQNMNQIRERSGMEWEEGNEGDIQRNEEGDSVVEQQTEVNREGNNEGSDEVRNEVSSGGSSGEVRNEVSGGSESSEGNSDGSGSDSGDGSSGGGEGGGITGQVTTSWHSGNSFLGNIWEGIVGK